MTKIIPVDPAQNIYASDTGFRLLAKQDVLFEGRTVQKLTYRDIQSLIWKIGQIALAAIITLATLGFVFCFQKGIIWKKALAQFKDRTVHQNIAVQPAKKLISPPSIKPVPSTIVSVIVPPPIPTVAPAAPLSPADLALQLKKEGILKENPEYGNAIQAWENANVSLADQVTRLEELRQYAFGTDKWVKYFGNIIGSVPLLPDDIYQICKSNDQSKPGEKVKDTHVLVLVPEAVTVNSNRTDITFKNLGELVKTPKNGGHISQYRCFEVKGHNTPIGKTYWVLMKKEIIPGSRNQTFAKQADMVKEYSQQAKMQYSMPNAIDVVVCCFMNFVDSGNRLFERRENWVRCQELVKKTFRIGPYVSKKTFPIIVGGVESNGLGVSLSSIEGGFDSVGVGALRKF